ncbi:MAG: Fic family protein [Candidatus Levybacteria bacterium]|nr:Fic family protein [Candidatus Levybacteria bacterium]
MIIPPKYILTPTISKYLQAIEAAKEVIDTITIPPEVETNIRRLGILKSSLFSARIEGNPLTIAEVTGRVSSDQKKREVYNILKGLQLVHDRGARDVTQSFLFQLHLKTMDGMNEKGTLGKYRTEVSAIFNSSGIAIYMPPPPRQIPTLMERLLKIINSSKEQFVPIRAVLAHYTFEKIHPFLDGNGRVGRLLLQSVLEKAGYGMKGLLTVEEYLDKHRSTYYDSLQVSERDVTDYVEFMLEAISETAEKAKHLVLSKQESQAEDYLLPRRAEIYNIIKDHKLVNFDMLRRRFLKVNERTLRYDLKQLQLAGLIRKLGTTKGVYYGETKT